MRRALRCGWGARRSRACATTETPGWQHTASHAESYVRGCNAKAAGYSYVLEWLYLYARPLSCSWHLHQHTGSPHWHAGTHLASDGWCVMAVAASINCWWLWLRRAVRACALVPLAGAGGRRRLDGETRARGARCSTSDMQRVPCAIACARSASAARQWLLAA
jgi:hypothetical protein